MMMEVVLIVYMDVQLHPHLIMIQVLLVAREHGVIQIQPVVILSFMDAQTLPRQIILHLQVI